MCDNENIDTFVPLYEYNENLDKFINELIDHFEEWKNIHVDEFEINLTYNNRTFSLWIENKFYGYLNRVDEYSYYNNEYRLINTISRKQPSKETIQRFYNEVELKLGSFNHEVNEEWLNI